MRSPRRGGAELDEAGFIAALRGAATNPAARGLLDDAAVLVPPAGTALVLTHDMIVEGVHYLPDDSAADVAWKLLAVNLSDLAAKGARPLGVLLGFMLGDDAWDRAFADGLSTALATFGVPLLGGDTVAGHAGERRALGLTAIGAARSDRVPDRRGARAGDTLWLSGPVGEAGLGLRLLRGEAFDVDDATRAMLVHAYRRPAPRLDRAEVVGRVASASADVSDGVLIDAARIAAASGLSLTIALDALPLSAACRAAGGDSPDARVRAATAGDDYQILLAAPDPASSELADNGFVPIGIFAPGSALRLTDRGIPIPVPGRLGYEHAPAATGT